MRILLVFFFFLITSAYALAQNTIEFSYTLKTHETDTSIINVEAMIINKSDKPIYFLSESCNELDYYILTNDSSVESYIMLHCNISFPLKIEVNPNASFRFLTQLLVTAPIDHLQLTLMLVQLDADTEVKGKMIHQIRKEYIDQTIEIKGPVIFLKN
ncbi:hypothetical protein [Cytophaga hutchinsonii]|uniref:Uncharacterized protein n=1 Tax=Cytophaga hutchinsonii (strain ATCC 33406 / DSM 1761 / CIP 103989 / NBRC 15051 / NCIMB 9469 / D465) TaxID=269798 RepID=A0A6N4STR4_CYTH3|nr:hypothetical protein [Cytophaga hutchinsonii]ABG59706.1 hypothetical protein CHU_2451 [Cytophaga hutchinsonii ATCC 33406]SFX65629.1 hypothetical protein SAMN04487930_10781 [Cytophaga hutchinsonii ATCC 33406]